MDEIACNDIGSIGSYLFSHTTSCSSQSPNNPSQSRQQHGKLSLGHFCEQTHHFHLRLIDSLKEMVEREMGGRAYARSLGLGEILEEEDRPEDQYQCTICKMFCYLSQITCQCKSEVVCIEHAEFLCDHSVPQLI